MKTTTFIQVSKQNLKGFKINGMSFSFHWFDGCFFNMGCQYNHIILLYLQQVISSINIVSLFH